VTEDDRAGLSGLTLPNPGIETLRWLYHYIDWMRPITQRALDEATIEQFQQPGLIPGGPDDGSLRSNYAHMVTAEGFWLSRWMKIEPPTETEAALRLAPIQTLHEQWDRLSAIRAQWLAQLTDDALVATSVVVDGSPLPLWPTLMHVVLHTAHHRAEVFAALTQLGHPPREAPDLIDFTIAAMRR
jgi:uncharacterized damage-inducible protein DinB